MKKSILAISKRELHSFYRDLPLADVTINCRTFGEVPGSISELKPDVIIIDCDNNTDVGFDLLQLIKGGHPSIPVVFITSHSSEDIVIQSYKLGARAFFKAPLNLLEIRATIDGLLKIRSIAREQRVPVGGPSGDGQNSTVMAGDTAPPNLLQTVNFILDHLTERYCLDDLAEKANMSKYHFCRSFTRHYGISPMKFITSMRISRATELLRRRNTTVSTIAYEMGYGDLGTFIRHFKKLTGQTPTVYKEKARKGLE